MIILKKADRDALIEHAIREFPNEACGILAGKDERVEKVYEMTNTDKTAATFFMDAKEQFKVMKDMRNFSLEMVGIYHSHVASEAYPSSHDVEMAFYPDASYVIVSLIDKNKPDVRSFKINEGKIAEEELNVV